MSVAAANGAVSTQHHHQATAEQIRLAQLIDDKKHDHPDVQDIVRRVLDVVADSTQEEALVALYDCDYDFEKAVALLIDKGPDVVSEWQTATHHKTTKKQQQKTASIKNGHGRETDENGQSRNNDGFTYRGKSGTGRSRFQQQQQQQNGGDSQQNSQQNDGSTSQQRQRGGASNYRGRFRGNNRGGGQRTNDRNYQQQAQDSNNLDASSPSDTTQRSTDVPYNNTNRRDGGGGGSGAVNSSVNNTSTNAKPQESQPWDVGNWNGETLVYLRSSKDDEQTTNLVNNNVSNTSHTLTGVSNGQYSSMKNSNVNNVSELNSQQQSKSNFDPMEAARHIKNVIGIGQTQPQQQQTISSTKPSVDLKPLMGNQQQQQKGNVIPSKPTGQNFHTKVTPPLPSQTAVAGPQRIPLQPVIFSDRFDGGMNKIDVQFGNLNETFDDSSVSIPPSSSSAFYPTSQTILSGTKNNESVPLRQNAQRSTEQSAFVSPTTHTNATRSIEQQPPVMNHARVLSQQIPQQQQQQQQQQQSMTMKPVVPQPYPVHHQQHPINAQSVLLHPLLLHPQQPESVALDASFDPAFQMPPIDFNSQYFMAAMNQQTQPTQARFLLSQPPQQTQHQPQHNMSNRQASSTNVQTSSLSNSSSTVPSSSTSTTTSTAPKKGPAIPPGIFPNMTQPTYSANYGVPLSVGRQQQTGATTYPYDGEHLLTNAFMQLANPQQAQSPSGAYGSVTPPVQQTNQQQQQTHANNDNKGLNYANQFHENLLLLQQYQQIPIPQSNSQPTTHSPAQFNYILGHAGNGPSYSPAPSILFAPPATAMAQHQQQQQQQAAKQQYNHANSSSSSGIGGNDDYYGRNSSSSSTKDTQYMYGQGQHVSSQSAGKQQQQQRTGGHAYNNQTNSHRSYQ